MCMCVYIYIYIFFFLGGGTFNRFYDPNLCKSHIFGNTANIENWPFFAYMDLMTKIDETGKIARNSFIG